MSWIKPKSPDASFDVLLSVAQKCSELGGPVSKLLLKMVESRDFLSLVNYDFDYAQFSNLNDAIYSRQIHALFSKSEWLDLGIDRESVAIERFKRSEEMCLETNKRFLSLRSRPQDVDPEVLTILIDSAYKIARILGRLPDLETLDARFGPGACTSVKGSRSNPRSKLSSVLVCSSNMSPFVGTFLEEVPNWVAIHADQSTEDSYVTTVHVGPGKLMFVPKNAKTHRSIVVEPILNGFFQKGYGSFIRDRLLRFGVDLRDQSVNQKLARQGSLDGSVATVDLSMASDCISRELVSFLLPADWYDALTCLRTAEVVHDRLGTVRLEKFSSMGNGYTFELESLIFYGICLSVCDRLELDDPVVSVYGDDIIIPTAAYETLVRVLSYCGFEVNAEKSFMSGPFRESCGADYHSGFDIRPFYQKDLVSERTLFTMHNWFVRHCEFELASLVDSMCNPTYKIYGPDLYGDGHLIGGFSLRRNRALIRNGWGGGYFDTYTLLPRRFAKPLPGDAVLPSYSVYTRSGSADPTDPNVVRGSCGYAKVSIYTLCGSIFRRGT